MELTLEEALKKGNEAHKAGHVQKAEKWYTAILQTHPKHPDANYNMGVLAVSVGITQQALPYFKTALEANPNIGQFWLSYIHALMKLGRSTEARTVFDQAKAKGASGEAFDQLEQQLSEQGLKINETNTMGVKSSNSSKFNILHTIKLDKALRLAKKKSKDGQLEEAKNIYQDILQKFPKHKNASIALQSLVGGPTVAPQDPPLEQLQSVISIYNQGQLQQALSHATEMLERFPNSVVLYNIAGASNAGLMQLDAAINNFKQALKIKPGNAEAYNNIGNALMGKGDLEAAVGSYKQALKVKPDFAEAYNNMGNALNAQGQPEVAIENYKQALKINPDYAEAVNNMGVALKDKGDPEAAIDIYKQALKIKPDYAEAYYNIGVALNDKGAEEAAIDSFKQALKIKPDYAEAYNNMGDILKGQGNSEAAANSFSQAVKIQPDNAEAHRLLSSLSRYKEHDDHFVKMQNLYLDPTITDDQRCHLSFALSKASEDLNEIGQSFTYLKAGNELRKKILSYDIKQDIELFSQLKKSFPSIAGVALHSIGEKSELKPIFILGMPRSGTTLVEQIVSSHSEVAGAGELRYVEKFGQSIAKGLIKPNSEVISDFRQRYIEALKKRSDARSLVTDKMPWNFRYVGLIFSAFPDAKVIHVNRDPCATCWSNYKHYFAAKGMGYGYDLEDIVTYFGLYQDLMQFWQGHYGDRIFDLNYDNLTINQEDGTRKLIQYLELQWEHGCLSPQSNQRSVRTASNQQVRQKVYQGSSQQWRKFEPYLNGAFDQLEGKIEQSLK